MNIRKSSKTTREKASTLRALGNSNLFVGFHSQKHNYLKTAKAIRVTNLPLLLSLSPFKKNPMKKTRAKEELEEQLNQTKIRLVY